MRQPAPPLGVRPRRGFHGGPYRQHHSPISPASELEPEPEPEPASELLPGLEPEPEPGPEPDPPPWSSLSCLFRERPSALHEKTMTSFWHCALRSQAIRLPSQARRCAARDGAYRIGSRYRHRGDPHHAQCALGVLYNPSPLSTILDAYNIEVGGKIVGETQTKALAAYHALFAATKRPRPRPSPAPQYAKHIGETVRVLTGPCTGHIGEITAVDGPSPLTFRVQFAAPVRCAEVGEVQAVWRQLDQLVFIDESA